jgi:hypothetical protein
MTARRSNRQPNISTEEEYKSANERSRKWNDKKESDSFSESKNYFIIH